MDLKGIVKRFGKTSGSQTVRLDELGNLAVSPVLPPLTQLCKAGRLFSADTHAGTAKAPVNTPPSTSPEWGLYNGNTNKALVLIQAAAWLKGGTSGLGLALFIGVTTGIQTTVPTDYSGFKKTNLNGGPFSSDAIICNSPSLVGGTPSYVVVANHGMDIAVDGVGNGLVAKANGMFIARPGYMIVMEVVGEPSTALFAINFVWAELDLDIE